MLKPEFPTKIGKEEMKRKKRKVFNMIELDIAIIWNGIKEEERFSNQETMTSKKLNEESHEMKILCTILIKGE